MPKERRFYCPPEDDKVFDDLSEILKREGKSLSRWIRDQARPYVELHSPGNPQQRLDVILKNGKAYHANQCTVCGNYPKWHGIQNGVSRLFCNDCFEREKIRLSGWKLL